MLLSLEHPVVPTGHFLEQNLSFMAVGVVGESLLPESISLAEDYCSTTFDERAEVQQKQS